jgi:uncharacterized damage-inducible protein DinB
MNISKPHISEHAPYYEPYIALVPQTDLVLALTESEKKFEELLAEFPASKEDYAYVAGKWSVKEVLIHMIDAERVFAYRALRFSRNDQTELSGFDENQWIPESNVKTRTLKSLIAEHRAVRKATIALFESFNQDMLMRTGVANGYVVSVRALGFIIAGHDLHHLQIIKDRYLSFIPFPA